MTPEACDDCLRRPLLLRLLAPYIEVVVADRRGSRCAELLRLGDRQLVSAIAPAKAAELHGAAAALDVPGLRNELKRLGLWACCWHDAAFPEGLADAADGPRALLARGSPELLRSLERRNAVTVVGSRRGSSYGLGMARDLSRQLAASGTIVVSGMANGIDAAAHEGALDAGGATVAVLGGGPERAYPRRGAALYRRIAATGLVLSELAPGSGGWRWIFPARNRVMAALAGMTVVVEAAERSGSLITAEMASDLGREVGAVPGPATSWLSAGCNRLLREGAAVVRDGQDVLDTMLGPGHAPVVSRGAQIDGEHARVLELLGQDGATCDSVATAARLPAPTAAARLARLELLGYARGDAAGRYFRTLLEAPDG